MNKKFGLNCVLCLFSGMTLNLNAETLVEDFEKQPGLYVYEGEERGGEFVLDNAPEQRGLSGKAVWKDKHHKYNEYSFKTYIPLPEFNDKLDGTFSVWVYGGPGNRAEQGIALRLIDSQGEVFQYRSPINGPLKPGWHKVVYRVTPDNVMDSWGTKSDKKFDLPARLLGFAIDFNPKIQGAGCIYFDDISHAALTKSKVKAKKQLWHFDSSEKWQAYGLQANDKLELTNDKWNLSLSSAKAIHMICRKDRLKDAGKISEITLKLGKVTGEGSISIGLRTKDGKKLILKSQDVKTAEILTWELAKDLINHTQNISGPHFIDSVTVFRKDAAQPLSITFDSGSVTEVIAPTEAIKVDLETGNPIHVLKDGAVNKLAIKLRNDATETLNFRIEATLENYFHQTINFSDSFVLSPQSETIWQSPVLPRQQGIWWLKYRIISEGGELAGRRSFAYMKPAGPTPGKSKGFIFGMCTHTERWSKGDHELEVMAAGMCGAKVIRTGVTWGGMEPSKGQWTFAAMDRLVDLYGKNGMEIQGILAFTPKWAAPPETHNTREWTDWNRAVPDIESWKNYVRTVTKRYGDRIQYWEVWNEPDLNGFFRGNRDDYLKMMKAAYQEAKAVNPDLLVMTGGFASLNPHPGKKDPDFHDVVISEGEGFYDIHAFHQHGNFDSFQQSIDGKMAEIRKKLKNPKPLYFNETAIHSLGDSQRNQAEVLVKKMLFSMARGAIGYNWYDLRNDGFDARDAEHNFGLLTTDFYPKAAYPAYNNVVLNFRGKKFLKQLDLGANRWAFVFEGNGEQTIVTWNEVSGDAGEHIVLKTTANSAEYIDIMGNATTAAIEKQMIILPISTTPSYLTLKGADKLPIIRGNLIGIKEQATVVPDKSANLNILIFNAFSIDAEFEINLYKPEGVQTDWQNKIVKIKAGKQSVVPLKLQVSSAAAEKMNDKIMLKVLYRVIGSPWSGLLPVPLNLAKLINPDISGKPDFVIDQRANVFNLCENDPATQHLTWQGPKDLSAKVKLGKKDQTLILKATVNDDIHSQKFSGPFVWKGDNIQFALQIPGQTGRWEFGLTRLDNDKPEVYCWSKTTGMKDTSSQIKLTTEKTTGGVNYLAEIPYQAIGVNDKILKQGIKFNLVVNDNDGDVREGWIQIAPGIADRKDPEPYPFVVFDIP